MLKFQNNDTTIIATFEDFILTTYVIIDELVTVQGLAGLERTLKGGIIMLKFQNNDTTIIATFEDFILTTYVIIDELVTVQGLAGLERTDGVD